MSSDPKLSPKPSSKPSVRTFRQRGAFVTGWFLIAIFLVVLAAITFGSHPEAGATLLLLAVVGAVYLSLIRPSVRLSADGVRLDNLVREVRLTWPAVDMLEDRWNLKVVTPDGAAYSSWAISAQRPTMSGGVSQNAAGSMVPTGTSSVPMGQSHRTGSAGAVAAAIEEAKVDYERAVSGGRIEPQPAQVHQVVAPVAAAGWAAVVVAVIVGILLI